MYGVSLVWGRPLQPGACGLQSGAGPPADSGDSAIALETLRPKASKPRWRCAGGAGCGQRSIVREPCAKNRETWVPARMTCVPPAPQKQQPL